VLSLRWWGAGDLSGGLAARTDCTKKPIPAHGGALAGQRQLAMNSVDRVIRWSTALAVVGVAAVDAVVSCEPAYALVREHGESGWTGRLTPNGRRSHLCQFDGDAGLGASRFPGPALVRWLL
jgi:hypothetical protein